MLFNSIEYLFVFLPLAVAAFYVARALAGGRAAMVALIVASLVFYGSWRPEFLLLLVGSIGTNFCLGQLLLRGERKNFRLAIAILGIGGNLFLLGYFKYTGFVIANLNALTGTTWALEQIILPLGISFFTFQQIAYLVDCYRREVVRHGPLEYGLLVTLFPHLIAGPITQPKHVLDQFSSPKFGQFSPELMVQGIMLFIIGLGKKVLLADNLAHYATPVFSSAAAGNGIRFFEGWIGALSFTFQLYFDFSGYSDMAVGAALLFGIFLPVNFRSPYRATSVIEFWRRWHITLSDFLRNYLYIPLGGNRRGQAALYRNVLIVMLLGGIWHGAGWTFVVWGLCHGIFLVINHAWRNIAAHYGIAATAAVKLRTLGWVITFIAVVLAWVPFRADSVESAWQIVSAMLGANGIMLSPRLGALLPFSLGADGFVFLAAPDASWLGYVTLDAAPLLLLSMILCFFMPPSTQLVGYRTSQQQMFLPARGSYAVGLCCGIVLLLSALVISARSTSEFLYYQF